jgi:hypothetical protein
MFFIELVLPFLIFLPRRLRQIAAFSTLLLESCILITGNYNWFNLQTMLLCLPLFDDAAIQKVLPRGVVRLLRVRAENKIPRRPSCWNVFWISASRRCDDTNRRILQPCAIFDHIEIGALILLWWVLWTVIRCVKGLLALNLGEPIRNPNSWWFGDT